MSKRLQITIWVLQTIGMFLLILVPLLCSCDPPSDIATVGMLDSLRTECSQADEHYAAVNDSLRAELSGIAGRLNEIEILAGDNALLISDLVNDLYDNARADSLIAARLDNLSDHLTDLESRLYDLELRIDSLTAIANDTTWTGWRIEWDENTEPDLSHYSIIGMQDSLAGTMRLHRPYLRVETVRPWVAVDTVYKGIIYVTAWDSSGNQATGYEEVK